MGLTHLQFEAMLTTARQSSNRFDFALVSMLGLLGLRIFEAHRQQHQDLGEEHGLGFSASEGTNEGDVLGSGRRSRPQSVR